MRITALVENIASRPDCEPAHGLSLWVETGCQRLLMDAGPSDVLLRNAKALGIDVSKADMLVLSHGHYDHAGGMLPFAALAPDTPIYLRRTATEAYFSGSSEEGSLHFIGIDPAVRQLPQLYRVDGTLEIGEGLWLFGDITGRKAWPEANRKLSRKIGERYVQDSFDHEQCLVIREKGLSVLLSGCAHNGVLNILDRFFELWHVYPDVVISGFHMKKSLPHTPDEEETIRTTARALCAYPCRFYTCHCTGLPAYGLMKEIMGDQLSYLRCGDVLKL